MYAMEVRGATTVVLPAFLIKKWAEVVEVERAKTRLHLRDGIFSMVDSIPYDKKVSER